MNVEHSMNTITMTDLDWTGREHRMLYSRQCVPQPPLPDKSAVIRWLLPLTVLGYSWGRVSERRA
jgi:hypothetical protein